MDPLIETCRAYGLSIIEDAAESLGSRYADRHTGTLGLLGIVSFNGNKVVTTGGGGAVLTNDAVLARATKHATTTARIRHHWEFRHDQIGYNYRMPNLNAALGCAQLEQLPAFLEAKRALATRYADAFSQVPGVRLFAEAPGVTSNYWLNALILDPEHAEARDRILDALHDERIEARPAWTPMPRLPMYQGCPAMDLATAESLFARVINLPSSAHL
jgi:perosamine synthetase